MHECISICRNKAAVPSNQMQTSFNETLAVLFSNVVPQRTISPLCPIIVFISGLRIWCLEGCAHNCGVFVWFPSDERHSVQPSNQVHRSLRRPPQHLHHHRILPPRQPAGNVTFHVSPSVDGFNCFCQEMEISKMFYSGVNLWGKTLNPKLFRYML